MPIARQIELKPRKTPVQARSSASVEAIFEACVQVLLAGGKEKLTTSRVAARAGVSVGTLYQYFPNKSSLLRAVLRAHLETIYGAIDRICGEAAGKPLAEMGEALVDGFVAEKLRRGASSRALYFISDDVGGSEISRSNSVRAARRIAEMLETAPEKLRIDAHTIGQTVISSMSGVSRLLIEAGYGSETESLQHELTILIRSYLSACAG